MKPLTIAIVLLTGIAAAERSRVEDPREVEKSKDKPPLNLQHGEPKTFFSIANVAGDDLRGVESWEVSECPLLGVVLIVTGRNNFAATSLLLETRAETTRSQTKETSKAPPNSTPSV